MGKINPIRCPGLLQSIINHNFIRFSTLIIIQLLAVFKMQIICQAHLNSTQSIDYCQLMKVAKHSYAHASRLKIFIGNRE